MDALPPIERPCGLRAQRLGRRRKTAKQNDLNETRPAWAAGCAWQTGRAQNRFPKAGRHAPRPRPGPGRNRKPAAGSSVVQPAKPPKKGVSPQRSSLSKIQAIAAARGIRIRSASLLRLDQTDARAAPASPLWARRLRLAPLKTQTQCQPPFGAPAFRAHPAARQAKRRPFGAVWSPAPVCHPIRIPSPAGQIGRRNAACSALKPGAALVVAFTQQSVQPLKRLDILPIVQKCIMMG